MKRILLVSSIHVLLFFGTAISPAYSGDKQFPQNPQIHDPRLRVDLFAAAPDIVHPIGVAFDHRGRLLVIESHTHFRPSNYKGPKHDRVRLVEDSDGDGKADRFTTFFEGTRATMDIAVHPDGSVYLATRNEILRLRDADGDGKAEDQRRIVFLDTKGDYPHNGISGLAFDSRGNLYFGLGENLGAAYKLIGTDGTTLTGGGEGGSITDDGKVRTGMLVKTELDQYTYLDARGDFFKVNTRTIVENHSLPTSIMPDGLPDLLTDRELRNLLAYLVARH